MGYYFRGRATSTRFDVVLARSGVVLARCNIGFGRMLFHRMAYLWSIFVVCFKNALVFACLFSICGVEAFLFPPCGKEALERVH